jgi:ABC-type nitrate/sulfonate/bicarbonate transport system substrate-binding protein
LATEDALISGSVDAVVIWEPHATRIKERLGKNAISWPVQGRDDYYFLLITTEAFLRRSPATAEKMLRALIDAEAFADKHPEEAQRIIEPRIKYLPGDVQLRMARSTLKVRLDQALLTGMEAEAQWMIRNNLTTKKEMPNYLDMIDLKPLGAVKPEAVGIIH